MASINKTKTLASGAPIASQSPEALLRRSVLACLLWEDVAYQDGESNANFIASLVPRVAPEKVFEIAVEASVKQKLRHIPLHLIIEMCKYPLHKQYVRDAINTVVTRPDQLTELLAIYWKDGRKPIPRQLKLGLADAFNLFDEYQFAKYANKGSIKLRDVLRLVHPKPCDTATSLLFNKLKNKTLAPADTWEVALSSGKDKKATWERLIRENKLGGLAFLRNLSNIINAERYNSAMLQTKTFKLLSNLEGRVTGVTVKPSLLELVQNHVKDAYPVLPHPYQREDICIFYDHRALQAHLRLAEEERGFTVTPQAGFDVTAALKERGEWPSE